MNKYLSALVGVRNTFDNTTNMTGEPKQNDKLKKNVLREIPSSQFRAHSMPPDGNGFFRSFIAATLGGREYFSDNSMLQLREYVAKYVQEYSDVLKKLPVFEHAGMQALYELLLTAGQWDADAGDLVPIVTAQATGREIHVLQPGDNNHYQELQVIPAHNRELPGPDISLENGKQPPIYLLKNKASNYEYLEKKQPEHRHDLLADTSNLKKSNKSKMNKLNRKDTVVKKNTERETRKLKQDQILEANNQIYRRLMRQIASRE